MPKFVRKIVRPINLLKKTYFDCDVNEMHKLFLERRHEISREDINDTFFDALRDKDSNKNVEFVRLLLANGAYINFVKGFGTTTFVPLSLAIANKKPKLVVELILQGADINCVINENWFLTKHVDNFEMLMFYFVQEDCFWRLPFYLMLLRGATLHKQSIRYRHYYNFYFTRWENYILVYCLQKKYLSHLIFTF
jgi:hypothetical protein